MDGRQDAAKALAVLLSAHHADDVECDHALVLFEQMSTDRYRPGWSRIVHHVVRDLEVGRAMKKVIGPAS